MTEQQTNGKEERERCGEKKRRKREGGAVRDRQSLG